MIELTKNDIRILHNSLYRTVQEHESFAPCVFHSNVPIFKITRKQTEDYLKLRVKEGYLKKWKDTHFGGFRYALNKEVKNETH